MSDTAARAREQRIAEIRERERKATKGPWLADANQDDSEVIYVPIAEIENAVSVLFEADWATKEDVEFATHARADIPFLLEQLAAQSAPVEEVARDLAQAFRDWRDSNISKYYSYKTPDEVFAIVLRQYGYGAQGQGVGPGCPNVKGCEGGKGFLFLLPANGIGAMNLLTNFWTGDLKGLTKEGARIVDSLVAHVTKEMRAAWDKEATRHLNTIDNLREQLEQAKRPTQAG